MRRRHRKELPVLSDGAKRLQEVMAGRRSAEAGSGKMDATPLVLGKRHPLTVCVSDGPATSNGERDDD